MQKILLFFITVFFCCNLIIAQTDSLSKQDKALLDSMMANDEVLKMMQEKEKNSIDISIGLGNGAFSSTNQAENATGINKQLIIMPGIMYRTKTGFSFGVTGYLAKENPGKSSLYQTGVSAAYEYYGKKISTGISYTRFLSDKNKYNNKSLYQNDFYGYLKKIKGPLQPGLAIGFSNGNYKDASFTSFILRRPLRGDTLISGIDSTDNKASYFSVSASVGHNFNFYNLFAKKDGLDIEPLLLLNMGSDKNTQTHTNRIYDRIQKLNTVKRVESNNTFQLQSIGAALDFTYGIGKFFLQPNLYIDYYLPQTTEKRLSTIFTITTGFTF